MVYSSSLKKCCYNKTTILAEALKSSVCTAALRLCCETDLSQDLLRDLDLITAVLFTF